jgi:hypothetical protein
MLRDLSTTDCNIPELFMTSSTSTPAPETVVAEDSAADQKAPVPAFSFPFKPADFAQSKKDQPWYQKSNKSGHNKIPGAAPHGTRKSMGKR